MSCASSGLAGAELFPWDSGGGDMSGVCRCGGIVDTRGAYGEPVSGGDILCMRLCMDENSCKGVSRGGLVMSGLPATADGVKKRARDLSSGDISRG